MSDDLKLEGITLGTAATRVILTGGNSYGSRVRQGSSPLHQSTETTERLGRNKHRGNITFTLIGGGVAIHDQVKLITGILEDRDEWELTVPSGAAQSYAAFKNYQTAIFSTDGAPQIKQPSYNRVDIQVPYICHGAPISVGGSYATTTPVAAEMLTNDFSISESGLATPLVGLPPQMAGYPKVLNTSTGVETTVTAGATFTASLPDGTAASSSLYDLGDGWFPDGTHAQGEGGPIKLITAPSSTGPQVGDVRAYKALISGFDGTATDIEAEGWTQLTGTDDLGQSATELLVIDDGLTRWAFDKNVISAGSIRGWFFNGTAWIFCFQSSSSGTYSATATGIRRNAAGEVSLNLTTNNVAGETQSATVTVRRGIPALEVNLLSGGLTGEWDWMLRREAGQKTMLGFDGSGAFATDEYGNVGFVSEGAGADNWVAFPDGDNSLILTFNRQNSEAYNIRRGANYDTGYDTLVDADTPTRLWYGALQWTWGAGDATPSGNSDGQLREAEDNPTLVAGNWASANCAANVCSNDKVLQLPSSDPPAVNDAVEWDADIPLGGEYYIGLAARVANSGYTLDVGVDGDESESGGAQSIPTTVLENQENQLLYGTYDLAAATATIRATLDAVGTAADVDLDFLATYPYQASASTPAGSELLFPKDFCNALLVRVTQ